MEADADAAAEAVCGGAVTGRREALEGGGDVNGSASADARVC